MNTLMKASVAIALIAMSGCVAKKKYLDSVQRNADLQEQLSEVETDLAKYKNDYKVTKRKLENLELNAAISAKENELTVEEMQGELSTKQKELQERLRQLEELRTALESQRATLSSLKDEVCSALKCYAPDELGIEERDGKIYVSLYDELLFPSGGEYLNAKGKEALTKVANVLQGRDFEILVEGHTDDVPINTVRNKDNWDLSTHRANNVSRYLIDKGIEADRVISAGRADKVPLKPNTSAENRKFNRRTEIILEPKLDKIWYLTESEDMASNQ
ncbi:MAG: OmpA family protein [Flavobacteriales bacterium]|nr:OmpA family protein [Flavobacteriales bacterium]